MQRLEVSGAVRPIYVSLGVKRLSSVQCDFCYTLVSKNLFVKCLQFDKTHLCSLVCVWVLSVVQ